MEKSEIVYHDIKIKSKDDKYFITGSDDFSLILQRVGERIVVDELVRVKHLNSRVLLCEISYSVITKMDWILKLKNPVHF